MSSGIVANQPKQKGGVLFVDSADKAARFIQTCDAFNVPLLFLADVPGFMIGTAVERQGIIRHGAKMISAVSEATVPKLTVIVRKAYGAGLYAMAGPAFDPDACLALPTASIAVMGPSAAVNAVFYNQLQAIEDPDERARRTEDLRREYAEDIDILHLASELVIDAVIQPEDLRDELVKRFALAAGKARDWPAQAQPDHAGVAARRRALRVRRARAERAGQRLVLVLVVVGVRRRRAGLGLGVGPVAGPRAGRAPARGRASRRAIGGPDSVGGSGAAAGGAGGGEAPPSGSPEVGAERASPPSGSRRTGWTARARSAARARARRPAWPGAPRARPIRRARP